MIHNEIEKKKSKGELTIVTSTGPGISAENNTTIVSNSDDGGSHGMRSVKVHVHIHIDRFRIDSIRK